MVSASPYGHFPQSCAPSPSVSDPKIKAQSISKCTLSSLQNPQPQSAHLTGFLTQLWLRDCWPAGLSTAAVQINRYQIHNPLFTLLTHTPEQGQPWSETEEVSPGWRSQHMDQLPDSIGATPSASDSSVNPGLFSLLLVENAGWHFQSHLWDLHTKFLFILKGSMCANTLISTEKFSVW